MYSRYSSLPAVDDHDRQGPDCDQACQGHMLCRSGLIDGVGEGIMICLLASFIHVVVGVGQATLDKPNNPDNPDDQTILADPVSSPKLDLGCLVIGAVRSDLLVVCVQCGNVRGRGTVPSHRCIRHPLSAHRIPSVPDFRSSSMP